MLLPFRSSCLTARCAVFLTFFACIGPCLHAQTATQSIVINEAVSSNVTTLEDADGDFEDWVELHNVGTTAVNLSGWGFSDDDEPFKWTFPSLTLEAGQYVVVWTSGKDRRPDTPAGQSLDGLDLHTNFSISAGGETLLLTQPDGTLHDSVEFPKLRGDIAYGRSPDNRATFFYFADPTPGAANTTTGFLGVLDAPELSHEAGFYTSAIAVTATHDTAGVSLHYSLDGALPALESPQFSSAVTLSSRVGEPNGISTIPTATGTGYWGWNGPPAGEVFKISTLRVRAFKEGYMPSPVTTASYLIDPAIESRYTLPVVSLVTDAANLFDNETGLFVNENYLESGREWERDVHFELFIDNETAFSHDMGVRTHGGQSRLAALKSLRFYTRSEYGTSELEYALFPDKPEVDVYETFLLRSGGNNWGSLAFRDALASSLLKDVSTVDIQYSRPAVVFINGEFWGMMNFRDRFDDKYIEHHYDIEDIDMLEDGEPDEGSSEHYDALLDFLATHDIAAADNYTEVSRRIDIDNFRDYHIAQTYYMNVDQPGKNVRIWRSQSVDADNPYADGRWRWLLYDVDLSMASLGDSLAYMTAHDRNALVYNTNLNHFGATTVNGPPSWGDVNDPQATLPLRALLHHEGFRRSFINRFADLLNTAFSPANVLSAIDRFAALQRPDIGEHFARWGQSSEFWENEILRMKNFVNLRPGFMRQHIVEFFGLPGQTTVTVDANPVHGKVQVNSMPIDAHTPGLANPAAPYPWTGTYFQSIPLTLIAVPEPGYAFSHWEGLAGAVAEEDAVTLTPDASPVSLRAIFVETARPELVHYWNFNDEESVLEPASGTASTSGRIQVTPAADTEVEVDDGQDFAGTNARLDAPVGTHLRLNEPLGAMLTFALPTTGFEGVAFSYETRRSGKGAGTQNLSYTTDGSSWTTLGAVVVPDGAPTLVTHDLSTVAAVANNPRFAVRITFEQGAGGDEGNNRFDNFVVEGFVSDLPPPPPDIAFLHPTPTAGETSVTARPGDVIPLQAQIADTVAAVAAVTFHVGDSVSIIAQAGENTTWTASLDTTALPIGAYTLQAEAFDAAGNAVGLSTGILIEILGAPLPLVAGLPVRPAEFPASAYLAHNADLRAYYGSFANRADLAWQHYWLHGIDEGRTFADDFHPDVYLGLYGDLRAAFGNDRYAAIQHWLIAGKDEGRLGNIPATFNVSAYLARHGDLRDFFGDDHIGVFLHYLNYGVFEGRVLSDDFHAGDYLMLNPDLQDAFGDDLQASVLHWLLIGKEGGRPGRLAIHESAHAYLARYPDLGALFGTNTDLAFEHYLAYGITEGRIFDATFQPAEYLALHADLRETFGNDLEAATIHWFAFGKRNGRQGRF